MSIAALVFALRPVLTRGETQPVQFSEAVKPLQVRLSEGYSHVSDEMKKSGASLLFLFSVTQRLTIRFPDPQTSRS